MGQLIFTGRCCFWIPSSNGEDRPSRSRVHRPLLRSPVEDYLLLRLMEEGVVVRQPASAVSSKSKFCSIFIRWLTAIYTIAMLVWLCVLRFLYQDPEAQDPSTVILCLFASIAPTVFFFLLTREDMETYT